MDVTSLVRAQMMLLDIASAVASFAANWLVQSTLLIAAGLAIGRLLHARGSALQSAVYRTTLAAALACPLATSLLALGGVSGWSLEMPAAWTFEQVEPAADDNADVAEAADLRPVPAAELSAVGFRPIAPELLRADAPGNGIAFAPQPLGESLLNGQADEQAGEQLAPAAATGPANAATSSGQAPPQTVKAPTFAFDVRLFGLAATGLAALWIAASAGLLLRLGRSARRLNHLRSDAAPAEAAAQHACRELAALLHVAAPEVLRSPYLAGPCLAGLLRPAVLLPEADPSLPVRDVLIHELAHLHRCDGHWNLLRRLAEAAFFYQPLLWILTRRMEVVAEEVCDDYVVHFGGDREQYARGLVEIAELSLVPAGAASVGMVSLRSILAKRVLRIMVSSRLLSTRVGNLLLAVVIAAGLAGVMMAGLGGLGAQRSLADAQAPGDDAASADDKASDAKGNDGKEEDDAAVAETKPTPADDKEQANEQPGEAKPAPKNQLEGIVIGANGKPVAGAKLYWLRTRVHDIDPQPPRLLATTDKDGRYQFVESAPVPAEMPASWEYTDRIVITASGHGFKFTSAEELRRERSEAEGLAPALARALLGGRKRATNLPRAGDPIRGRLVDINGQPVAGAKVRIRWFNDERDIGGLAEAKAQDVKDPVWQTRISNLLNVIEPVQLRDALPSAVTDAEGRFELRDIGPKRLVQLLVEGEGIEATEIVARNEPGEKIVVNLERHEGREAMAYPNDFLHAVGPSKPVTGRVLDLDSGDPIAGAIVRAFLVHGERVSSSREREHFAVRTDAEGRYRITGLPVGKENSLVAISSGDVPYLPVARNADTSAPGGELQVDFRLKRGVWAEGRVYDAETRKPFTGEISYYFFRDRKLEEAIPGLLQAYVDGLYWTNAAGEFRVPVLPTRGILAFRYDGFHREEDGIDRFARGFGADKIAGSEDLGGAKAFPTAPFYLMPTNYERVAEVPVADGQETVRVDMPLFASPPVAVRVVDADGKPAIVFQTYGANERWGWQNQDGPQFEIQDLRPGERRKVFVFQRERNLAGGAFVEYGAKGAVEIKLAKAGKLRGRLLDSDGEPIDDAKLQVQYEKLHSGDNSAMWAPQPDVSSNREEVSVDKAGRFHIEGLIPGWSYHAYASAPRMLNGQSVSFIIGTPFGDVKVEPGEEKDLGDVTAEANKPNLNKADVERERPMESKQASSDSQHRAKVVRGRVMRNGRPASGADVAVVARKTAAVRGGDFSAGGEILAEGRTNDSGEYLLNLASASAKSHAYANVIARQQGAAIDWQQLNLEAADSKIDLELPADEPIQGRLIDLEGRPAAGVRLTIHSVAEPNGRGEPRGVGYQGDKVPAAWFAAVVSDEQGRFVIHGVPAGHGMSIEVGQNERFAPQEINLSPGANEQRGERDATYRPLVKNLKPGEEAVLTLSPAQPFAGAVRYADSGEPAPHARISIWASQQERFGSMISVGGRADENGHYQISPKPGVRFGLTAYPPDGVPYLARQTSRDEPLRWNASERVKQVDLNLPRGVLVRGRVVEAGGDAPVANAAVQYIPAQSNNPNASDDILTGWQANQLSDEDGRFSIAVLPGPGRLLVNGQQGNYVLQQVSELELSENKPGGTRNYAHAITKLDPKVGQETLEVKLELQPGATASGRIVDEQGNPIEEATVISRLSISPYSLFWRGHTTPTLGGRFELTGLAKDTDYPVYFLDPKRRLGATEIIKAGEGDRTVVLKPCGQARLRAVDKDGEPGADHVSVEMVVTPGALRYDFDAVRHGELAADADYVANIDRTNHWNRPQSDEQGYILLPALIPGATYRVVTGREGKLTVGKEFQAKSKETLDLGEILIERSE